MCARKRILADRCPELPAAQHPTFGTFKLVTHVGTYVVMYVFIHVANIHRSRSFIHVDVNASIQVVTHVIIAMGGICGYLPPTRRSKGSRVVAQEASYTSLYASLYVPAHTRRSTCRYKCRYTCRYACRYACIFSHQSFSLQK